MTKKLLLAAGAVAALAFAGSAVAAEISAATIGSTASPQSVTPGTSVYYLASTAKKPTGGVDNFKADIFIATIKTPAAVGKLTKGTYTVRFDLAGSGSPVFTNAVAATDVGNNVSTSGTVTCAYATSIIEGGGAGQNFVVAQVVVSDASGQTCDTAYQTDIFTLSKGITISSAGAVTVAGKITRTSATGTALTDAQGTAAAATVVQTADPYKLTITSDTVPTTLSLTTTPVYSALSTASGHDDVLGTVAYSAVVPSGTGVLTAAGSAVYAGINTNALPSTTATYSVTASGGDFSKLNLSVGSETVTESGATATTGAVAAGSAAHTVKLAGDSAGTTISTSPISFTAKIVPAFASGVGATLQTIALPSEVSSSVQTLGLDGTNFVAPWFTLNNANNVAFLRISNTGATATGPITLSLKAPSAAVATATCSLTQADFPDLNATNGIAANSAITLQGPDLASKCFGGTTIANGDLQVTIQAKKDDLTAQVRVRNSTGAINETSLGRLGETGVTF